MRERILIVDDEQDICDILQYNLQTEGYDVVSASSGEEALAMLSSQVFDLLLLDVMMDGISGFDVARRMKENPQLATIPIIFCTAKSAEEDVLDGFSLGSDDYITKPFRLSEVKARVKAVLRRSVGSVLGGSVSSVSSVVGRDSVSTSSRADEVSFEGLVLDTSAKTCRVDGESVALSKLEFELLAFLLLHPHTVYSREMILSNIWPDDSFVLDRTVDVTITRLRKKIGQYGKCIRTRFGYGYSFEK